jgi:hypothetical protein
MGACRKGKTDPEREQPVHIALSPQTIAIGCFSNVEVSVENLSAGAITNIRVSLGLPRGVRHRGELRFELDRLLPCNVFRHGLALNLPVEGSYEIECRTLSFTNSKGVYMLLEQILMSLKGRLRDNHRKLEDLEVKGPPSAKHKERAKPSIFLSYRREDSPDSVGRLYDRLVNRFGSDEIFKDTESTPLGSHFRDLIHETIPLCDVFLAVIGPTWQPSVHVVDEINLALQTRRVIIPVLVGGGSMPGESDLPVSIREFAFMNGIRVRPEDFDRDTSLLMKRISKLRSSRA